ANRLLEIRQTDLAVAVTIHGCPPSARFLPDFCCFPCTYYTTYGLLCLEIQGLFHYSVDIKYDSGAGERPAPRKKHVGLFANIPPVDNGSIRDSVSVMIGFLRIKLAKH